MRHDPDVAPKGATEGARRVDELESDGARGLRGAAATADPSHDGGRRGDVSGGGEREAELHTLTNDEAARTEREEASLGDVFGAEVDALAVDADAHRRVEGRAGPGANALPREVVR